jgi:hypothetical protein
MPSNLNKIFTILFVFFKIEIYSQTLTTYTYDANGNRITKQVRGSSPNPTVTASPEAVNPNQPSTLVATGCTGGTVQWLPDNIQAAQILVTPATTTQYTANCIVSGCTTNGSSKVTVNVIQCPSNSISAFANANTVRYGSQVILYANGCNIIDNGVNIGKITWSTGSIGSPSYATQFNSTTVYTATCGTQYCPNISSATVLVGGTTGCLAGDVMITKQDGSWNNVNTWACGRLPTSNDIVLINHQVTVYGFAGYAKSIVKGNGGTLYYDNLGTIFIPRN